MKRHWEIASTCFLANQYSIEDLSTKLLKSCHENLTIYNCALIYDQYLKLGDMIGGEYLDKVVEVINLNADLVFKSNMFSMIGKETLIKLLESDSLFIKEKDVFYGVVDWINAELSRQKLKINLNNQSKLFNEFKKLIRFPLMSKTQFDNGPANSQLFTAFELIEFDKYFETKDTNVLSVDYNANERGALQIYKLQFDEDDVLYKGVDRFFDDKNDGESEIEECDLIDFEKRDAEMQNKFGKNYWKDGKRQRKFATKDKDEPIEGIHVFKFCISIKKKEFNDDLAVEIHENGQKLDLEFIRYSKSGKYYFSLHSPVALTNAKEYRVCFRTESNQCWYNSLKIENVVTTNEEESKVDVRLRIVDCKKISMANMVDIYFVYKENYVHQDESIKDEESLKENDSSIENRVPKRKNKNTGNKKRKRVISSDESELSSDSGSD